MRPWWGMSSKTCAGSTPTRSVPASPATGPRRPTRRTAASHCPRPCRSPGGSFRPGWRPSRAERASSDSVQSFAMRAPRPVPDTRSSMSITLIAVVIALVVGHTMPSLVALRRYDWFIRWLEWLAAQLGDNASWRGAGGLLFAIGPPLLLIALLQIALRGDFSGFPAFVFALVALFYAWGPRDLDHDVEAVVNAADPVARRDAAARLFPDQVDPVLDGGSLVEAVFRCAHWRWFGVLFWFLLVGAFGALLYRLVSLCAQGEARRRLPEGASQAARTLLAFLDWPVAQLM